MKNSSSNKSGNALLFAMITLVILAIIGSASLFRAQNLQLNLTRTILKTQDEWNAQSGIEEAVQHLFNLDYTDFTATQGAWVDITENNATNYLVTTSYTNGSTIIRFRQEFEVTRVSGTSQSIPPLYIVSNPNNPMYDTNSPAFYLKNNDGISATTNGTELVINGDASFGNNSAVTGTNMTMLLSGDLLNGVAGSNVLTNQALAYSTNSLSVISDQMATYNSLISSGTNTVVQYSDPNGNNSFNLDLNGNTYVLSNESGGDNLSLRKTVNISGNGTLIIKGNLDISGNGELNISSTVNLLVGGDMNAVDFNTSSDNTVYVKGDLSLSATGNTAINSGVYLINGSMMTGNNVTADNAFIYINGYFYAEQSIVFQDVFLIANQFHVINNATITINPAVVPGWVTDGASTNSVVIISTDPVEKITRKNWTRL